MKHVAQLPVLGSRTMTNKFNDVFSATTKIQTNSEQNMHAKTRQHQNSNNLGHRENKLVLQNVRTVKKWNKWCKDRTTVASIYAV